MKRQFLFGTMLSAVLAVGVGAQQTQGGQTTGTSGADQTAARSGQTVTVTGCLQKGGQMAGGTGQTGTATGTTGAQAGQQAAGFILTNVTPSGAGAPGAGAGQTGQTGKTGEAGQAGAGQTGTKPGQTGAAAGARGAGYRLTGGEDQKLQQHVGQRVEVTGTITEAAGAGTKPGAGTGTTTGAETGKPGTGTTPGAGTGQTGAGAGTTTAQGAAGAMPTLRVTSVKQVSGTCP